jgi:hypothetical protein
MKKKFNRIAFNEIKEIDNFFDNYSSSVSSTPTAVSNTQSPEKEKKSPIKKPDLKLDNFNNFDLLNPLKFSTQNLPLETQPEITLMASNTTKFSKIQSNPFIVADRNRATIYGSSTKHQPYTANQFHTFRESHKPVKIDLLISKKKNPYLEGDRLTSRELLNPNIESIIDCINLSNIELEKRKDSFSSSVIRYKLINNNIVLNFYMKKKRKV